MGDEENGGGAEDGGNEALESEAKQLGWAPKEQWRGDPSLWRDASEFVRRSREILPIVNAHNRKLTDELAMTRQQLQTLKGTLDSQSQSMKDLLEHQATTIKNGVEAKLKALREEKRAAIREGDHDRAADLEEAIDETKDALTEANKPKPAAAPTGPRTFQGQAIPEDVQPFALEFGEANKDWLGTDEDRTALFMAKAEKLAARTNLRGKALLDEAKKQMEEVFAPKKTPPSKSEGGSGGWSGSNNGGGSGGKGFSDLPSDAKAVCKKQEAKFVGDGKAFKTSAEWQKHYANTFFASQE